MKICTICLQEKSIESFTMDKHSSTGYRNQCKECIRKRTKEQRVWERRKEGYNASMRKYRGTIKGALHTSLSAAKRRSKNSNIPFDLDIEYLIDLFEKQEGKCALTGDIMIPKSGRTSPSLDRMDPTLGYVRGNVQWTTWKSNCIKQDMNMEELFIFCEKVLKLRC